MEKRFLNMPDDFDMNIQCEELYDDEYGLEWADRFEDPRYLDEE